MSKIGKDAFRLARERQVHTVNLETERLYALRFLHSIYPRRARAEVPFYVNEIERVDDRLVRAAGLLISKIPSVVPVNVDIRNEHVTAINFLPTDDIEAPDWPVHDGYLLTGEKMMRSLPIAAVRLMAELGLIEKPDLLQKSA